MPRTSSKAKSKPGFSKRLNLLMDWVGYPQSARSPALGKELGLTGTKRTVTYPWLNRDIVPLSLKDVVKVILKDIPGYQTITDSVVDWLLTAKKDKSPKDFITLQQFQSQDYQSITIVFVAVHNMAEKLDIDLKKIPPRQLDMIYTMILKQMKRSPHKEIDNLILTDLLMSANPVKKSK